MPAGNGIHMLSGVHGATQNHLRKKRDTWPCPVTCIPLLPPLLYRVLNLVPVRVYVSYNCMDHACLSPFCISGLGFPSSGRTASTYDHTRSAIAIR